MRLAVRRCSRIWRFRAPISGPVTCCLSQHKEVVESAFVAGSGWQQNGHRARANDDIHPRGTAGGRDTMDGGADEIQANDTLNQTITFPRPGGTHNAHMGFSHAVRTRLRHQNRSNANEEILRWADAACTLHCVSSSACDSPPIVTVRANIGVRVCQCACGALQSAAQLGHRVRQDEWQITLHLTVVPCLVGQCCGQGASRHGAPSNQHPWHVAGHFQSHRSHVRRVLWDRRVENPVGWTLGFPCGPGVRATLHVGPFFVAGSLLG